MQPQKPRRGSEQLRAQVDTAPRRGVFIVIAAVCLLICMTFLAYGIDVGMIALTKTQMQSATDSAALAAAMEITDAISQAGEDVSDVFAYAEQQARDKAAEVAELNGVYVNSGTDVTFGRRYQDAAGNWKIDWNSASDQVNAVKVVARRTGSDTSAPDGRVPGLFSVVFNSSGTSLQTTSVSYIEPRDMVIVHDFSRSMNYDSYFNNEASVNLPQATLETNMQTVWNDLGISLGTLPTVPVYASRKQSNTGANATVTFKGTSVTVSTNTKIKTVKLTFESSLTTQSFSIGNETTTTGTWAGTGSNSGKRISAVDVTIRRVGSTSQNWTLATHSYDTATLQAAFSLTNVSWPWEEGSWSGYVNFVKTNGGLEDYGYRDRYGGMTLVCYLLRSLPAQDQCKDLWKTRHYPFHAIKEGHALLCDYLAQLGLGDQLGMVSYDSSHRIETTLSSTTNSDFPNVNIASDPITGDFTAVKNLMKYKQAAYYSSSTNMAGGMKDAVALIDAHKRTGSRPAIILMTDGNGNTLDTGETGALLTGWNWNSLFDYDCDGASNYSTSNTSAIATLKYVKNAVDKGYAVHCISVGVDADVNLLEAIAHLGNGYHINVPGGQSVSDMEADVKAAFVKIAAAVPPARLVSGE
jgi:hypothetical protein